MAYSIIRFGLVRPLLEVIPQSSWTLLVSDHIRPMLSSKPDQLPTNLKGRRPKWYHVRCGLMVLLTDWKGTLPSGDCKQLQLRMCGDLGDKLSRVQVNPADQEHVVLLMSMSPYRGLSVRVTSSRSVLIGRGTVWCPQRPVASYWAIPL